MLFNRSSNPNENVDIVRIDLTKRDYRSLMRSIKGDDAGSIKDCVEARLMKDNKGYFLRLPFTEARQLRGTLFSLWQKLSNETLKILPLASKSLNENIHKEIKKTEETERAINKFMALSKVKGDLGELIQTLDYQSCPEKYHPFGPR